MVIGVIDGHNMKTTQKGTRVEAKCASELKAQGYLVWKTIRVQYQNIDLFGLFDVVALAADGSHLLFVQCKSNRCDTKTRDAVKALKMPPCCQKWIYIWKDRKYWIKEFYE